MSALSEIIEKADVEEGWKKDARAELQAFRKELEDNAIANHMFYRDHLRFDNGHSGNFSDCPAYSCVKARQLIQLRFGIIARQPTAIQPT